MVTMCDKLGESKLGKIRVEMKLQLITEQEAQLFKKYNPVLHTVCTHGGCNYCLVCYQVLPGAYIILVKDWHSCSCDSSIDFGSDWAFQLSKAKVDRYTPPGFVLLSDVPYVVIRKVFYRLAARASYSHSCLEWQGRWIRLGKQYGKDIWNDD